ncbi:MAG: caspase family protein [Betaproteobacteria bacterium]
MTAKRAFIFGVDTYDRFSSLTGCVNDAMALEPLLASNEDGAPNFSVIARTSDKNRITRATMLSDLDRLLVGGADVALLFFAGHGHVEHDELHLVTQDGTQQEPGVPFSKLLKLIQESKVPEVMVLLDCCFSGGAGGVPILGSDTIVLRRGVSILTASRADQVSEEVGGQGMFSYYLIAALEGGAADVLGAVTVAGLYCYLSESFGPFDQRPMFRGHLDRLHCVRQCNPIVPMADLRRIVQFFPRADFLLQLDPSYEPTAEPSNTTNEAIFSILQRYRANKLLEPVGAAHMFFAAIERKHCKLTPLGKHYWNLVKRSLI